MVSPYKKFRSKAVYTELILLVIVSIPPNAVNKFLTGDAKGT